MRNKYKSFKDTEKLYKETECRRVHCTNCGHTIQFGKTSKLICNNCGIANYEDNELGRKLKFRDQFRKKLQEAKRKEYENGKLF